MPDDRAALDRLLAAVDGAILPLTRGGVAPEWPRLRHRNGGGGHAVPLD